MNEQWLTTEEAGSRLGKTDRQVRRDCHNSILACKREGKQLLVNADSVEALLQKQMSEPEECPQRVLREASEEEDFEGTDNDEGADIPQEGVTDTQQASDMDEDMTLALPTPPADTPSGSLRTATDSEDAEDNELEQTVAEVRRALRERLDTERRCIARVEIALVHLDRKYQAERKRNQKAQEHLKRVLSELEFPMVEKTQSLWRRMFCRQ